MTDTPEVQIKCKLEIKHAHIFFGSFPHIEFSSELYFLNDSNMSCKNPCIFNMPLSNVLSEKILKELEYQALRTLRSKNE